MIACQTRTCFARLFVAAMLLGALANGACSQTARAVSPSDTTPAAKIRLAERAALAWLALVDSSRYAMSWDSTATSFRSQVTQREWEAAAVSVRSQVDPLKGRSRTDASYTRELPDAPPGEYVVFQFSASSRDNVGVIETVTLTREANGSWRVIGYFIRPS